MAGNNRDILKRLSHGVATMKKLSPKLAEGFFALDKAALEPGTLDVKTKELIAIAVAVTARCDGCIAVHVNNALKAQATQEEIAEALGVAIAMGGGPSMVYATRVLEAVAEYTAGAS